MKENFIGNTRKYEEKLKEALLNYKERYYEDFLNKFQFSADWPILLDTQNFHLACYFEEDNYAFPTKGMKHTGIDIQVSKGTKIFAPENGKIFYCYHHPADYEEMSNVVFQGIESKLFYHFCHIEKNSITKERFLSRGDLLCNVGNWTWRIDSRKIPKEV
ncbi:MAG: M23 family metallopeptidase, partial [Candidatus Pacearchaeota archaeon]|nr:M23 family metallopeptidase [Candidatus Pacearchaeota archaeon]